MFSHYNAWPKFNIKRVKSVFWRAQLTHKTRSLYLSLCLSCSALLKLQGKILKFDESKRKAYTSTKLIRRRRLTNSKHHGNELMTSKRHSWKVQRDDSSNQLFLQQYCYL